MAKAVVPAAPHPLVCALPGEESNDIKSPHQHGNQPTPSSRNVTPNTDQPLTVTPPTLPHHFPLPNQEPPYFDGNLAQYRNFVDALDTIISYQLPEPKLKLYFLLKYTRGNAHT